MWIQVVYLSSANLAHGSEKNIVRKIFLMHIIKYDLIYLNYMSTFYNIDYFISLILFLLDKEVILVVFTSKYYGMNSEKILLKQV